MGFDDIVQALDETAVVAVVTSTPGGKKVATPIWAMVIDGVPYVRSVYGADAAWYRHVVSGRPVEFVLGDGSLAERDRTAALELARAQVSTVYVPVDDGVQGDIDDELRRKYAGQPSSVAAMLTDAARSCTLRIEPAAG
ncbi:hypothetical protein GCM10022240_19490 [Microbacterium kribbense]|uniref:DUF2255 family protein n=1 Tax=Microbacterium kribbense TaxID=433645 RepID=A0ABP7GM27_9MICO